MNQDISILYESLRRTDSYIVAADQKASFVLASGVTFLGIYTSIFYNLITSDNNEVPITVLVSIIGIVLSIWVIWFCKIKEVFSPKTTPSSQKSVVSFASIKANHHCFNDFVACYSDKDTVSQNSSLSNIELDLLENHWICSEICVQKMKAFKESLGFLMLALSISLLGLAFSTFYAEIVS